MNMVLEKFPADELREQLNNMDDDVQKLKKITLELINWLERYGWDIDRIEEGDL